jgi:enamine deaminase RidA (YjgF/YER057c/UK114 family)
MRRIRLAGQLAEPISHDTEVEVSALAIPDALVEIEAVALLPRRDA